MQEELYQFIENNNINYINHKLYDTKGMIAHYNDITAIVIDEKQHTSCCDENTTVLQELGHYLSGAYYKVDSSLWFINKCEYKADKKAWETFLPYEEIIGLLKNKIATTIGDLAEYFGVEPPYMARCVNYYANQYGLSY